MKSERAVGVAVVWLCTVLAAVAENPALAAPLASAPSARVQFEVSLTPDLVDTPASGRLLVILGPTNTPEPRFAMSEIGPMSPPRLGRDVTNFDSQKPAALDLNSALFPQPDLSAVPADDYYAQAVLMTNRDFMLPSAPGNLVSSPERVHFDPQKRG